MVTEMGKTTKVLNKMSLKRHNRGFVLLGKYLFFPCLLEIVPSLPQIDEYGE